MSYPEPTLFSDDWGEDDSPVDNTEIKQKIFYYSPEQWEELRKLSKPAMRVYFADPFDDGNLSDLFLLMLRDLNENPEKFENYDPSAHPKV